MAIQFYRKTNEHWRKSLSKTKTPVLYSESEKHKLGHISQTLLTELTQTPAEAKHSAGEGGVVMLARKASVSGIKRGTEHSTMNINH